MTNIYPKRAWMCKSRRLTCWMLIAIVASGCSRPVRPPAPAPAPPPSVDLRGAELYTIDPAASIVHIHVFRGGALSRLGHNHVVTSRDVSGRAWMHAQIERSGFELEFPVAALIVDDEAARRAAGPEFVSDLAESDRAGTRNNMLRASVLDAERHPTIQLRSASVSGELPNLQLSALVTIRGVTRTLQIPAEVRSAEGQLRVGGEFDLLQTDFGIEPFSVVLGALEVQDRLHVKYSLVLERES